MDFLTLLVTGVLADIGFCMQQEEICASPQYLELGKIGTINCNFQEEFFAVVWYNSTDPSKDDPLLHYQSFTKHGPGYTSGEFDVLLNGSLIINNVSLQHDHTFRAVYTPSDGDVPYEIDVRIIVKKQEEICASPQYLELGKIGTINCNFPEEIFAVVWYNSTDPSKDDPLLNYQSFTKYGPGFLSGEFDVLPNGSLLIDNVSLQHDHTFRAVYTPTEGDVPYEIDVRIIVKNQEEICPSPQYLELGKVGTISCNFQVEFFAVVWYNSTDPSKNDPLLHYQSFTKFGPGLESGEFDVSLNGSLIINNVSLQHDHTFRAVYTPSDGDVPNEIDVRIIVKIPANPVIDECNQHRTCIMEAKYEGNVTCRVKRIRPSVQLQWKAFGDVNSEVISFTNEGLIIEDKGEAYDITFKATYHITNALLTKITLECVDSEE